MNKVRRTFGGIMIMFTLILFSCKTSSIITKSAYYTETEKLSRLTNGMDVQQVNKMLEIEPYDVYFASDGCKILAYQYRLKYRKYKASLKKEGFNNETSQRAGIEYYDKPNMAYVYFVDDKMTSVITDEGLKEGAYIVTENNILKSISKNELVSFDKRAGLYKEGQVWEIEKQKGLRKVETSEKTELTSLLASDNNISTNKTKERKSNYGLKIGLNSSKYSNWDEADPRNGLVLGFSSEYILTNNISFQPELLFSCQGAKYSDGSYELIDVTNYLNVPLMFKYKMFESFNFQIGPQIGLLLSSKGKITENNEERDEDYSEDTKDLDLGINIGVGYEFNSSMFVDLRYNWGFTDIVKDNSGDKVMNRVWQFCIGYKF